MDTQRRPVCALSTAQCNRNEQDLFKHAWKTTLGPLRLRRNMDKISAPSCARIAEQPAGVMLLRPALVACR